MDEGWNKFILGIYDHELITLNIRLEFDSINLRGKGIRKHNIQRDIKITTYKKLYQRRPQTEQCSKMRSPNNMASNIS